MLSIPLYATAIITGYSRVKAKRHTVSQVVAAAVLSETAAMLNAKMSWSQNYNPINISILPGGGSVSFKINL